MNSEERARELVSKMVLEEKIEQMMYNAPAIERLGIPEYNWWNECLHGVARAGCATVFPQAIAMASSFDDELLEEVATAISDEARAKYNEYKKFGGTQIYQGLTFWSPNINIFRDPRWGRGHETYGEDPYLTGRMGSAFVRGLQGNGKFRKLDATLKHYAVHSGPEGKRHEFNAVVSDEDLYKTYLWAFKYCIDHAKPAAVMGAYNRVAGEPCCGSETLLKKILREEFGFEGYVVSDCGAICDFDAHHKVTKTKPESAALAVNNGCELNCGKMYRCLKTAVEEGLITEEVITEAVVKLFKSRFELGMFDECEYDNIPYDVVECDKHIALSRKMAADSMVLLKNDGILPLKKNTNVAVIGPNADDRLVLLGNYNGTPSKYTTLLRGIQDASEGKVLYARGCNLYQEVRDWREHPTREALIAAEKSDVVIMVLGLSPDLEGEEKGEILGLTTSKIEKGYKIDNSGDKINLEIPYVQMELYKEIVKLNKPIIFVNVSGSCVNLSEPKESANAIIQCFYPGAEGGNALADIIYGNVSPSGRLPVTFYKSVDDLPDFEDYSMENRTYKYFKGTPVYEFGYGLTYSKIEEKWINENKVEITNKGDFDTGYSVLKFKNMPEKTLTAFKKIYLKKGESKIVEFKGDLL